MIQDPLGRDASDVAAPAGVGESRKLRSVPRYPFIADAEVVESCTKAHLVARVSEIGLKGYYIDLLNPLPAGLSISVKIFKDNQTFEEEAQVVYTQPTMGMGVVFIRMNPDHQKVLEGWIQNLGSEGPLNPASSTHAEPRKSAPELQQGQSSTTWVSKICRY